MSGVYGTRLFKRNEDKYIIWYSADIADKDELLHYNIYLANNPTEFRDANSVATNPDNIKIYEVVKKSLNRKYLEIMKEGVSMFLMFILINKLDR